ncbi:SRPBCC family protein [Flavobacterium selenitireducens]|uniref:SRPBCC family protein n=1 Tax=Flavobacterium selenitireducens TaxID=2722704 RepID=UPI00168AE4CE|nr:SRPBCC family protein [Flavobacterium selenitireducens]MBD3583692.1 SRPBCC family protein [Flavobacterium selenitireducens]
MQRVFDLSRSLEIHLESTAQTSEKIIGGKMQGLLQLGETVTWKGRHFGLWLTHESSITEMQAPQFFVDEMVSGHFKSFRHEHHFDESYGKTTMRDIISYDTPLGLAGAVFDRLVLRQHLDRLMTTRNQFIRQMAEKAVR